MPLFALFGRFILRCIWLIRNLFRIALFDRFFDRQVANISLLNFDMENSKKTLKKKEVKKMVTNVSFDVFVCFWTCFFLCCWKYFSFYFSFVFSQNPPTTSSVNVEMEKFKKEASQMIKGFKKTDDGYDASFLKIVMPVSGFLYDFSFLFHYSFSFFSFYRKLRQKNQNTQKSKRNDVVFSV